MLDLRTLCERILFASRDRDLALSPSRFHASPGQMVILANSDAVRWRDSLPPSRSHHPVPSRMMRQTWIVSRRKKNSSGNPARRGMSFQGRVVIGQFERWITGSEMTFTEPAVATALLERLLAFSAKAELDILTPEDAEGVVDLLLDGGADADVLLDVFHDYVHFRLETDQDSSWEDVHELLEEILENGDGPPDVIANAMEQSGLQDPHLRRAALSRVRAVAQVRELLAWIGSGRAVTDSGALRRADIEGAARILGLAARGVAKLPTEGEYRDGAIVVGGESLVQSMWNLPPLSAWWEGLRAADLIEVTRTRVLQGAAASTWLADELPPLDEAGELVSIVSAQLLTFAQTGEPDAWASALVRLTVVQAIETLEPGSVDATPTAIEDMLLPRALRSLEYLVDMGVLELSALGAFSVPELLRGPFAGGIALALAFLSDEPERDYDDIDDVDPFRDPAVEAEMARLGIVYTPGMAAEMMRELAPLLAEDGIDLDDLETDVDLDTINAALARATERRNLELFTPVGEMRAMALTVHRLVTEALAEGSAQLARAIIDSIQPDPVGTVPSVAHVIGVGLGTLDQWKGDGTPGFAVARAQPPTWNAEAMQASRDILRAARNARAFDQLENLHRRYGGHAVLEGTLLAVAGTVIAQAVLEGVEVREIAGRMLSE